MNEHQFWVRFEKALEDQQEPDGRFDVADAHMQSQREREKRMNTKDPENEYYRDPEVYDTHDPQAEAVYRVSGSRYSPNRWLDRFEDLSDLDSDPKPWCGASATKPRQAKIEKPIRDPRMQRRKTRDSPDYLREWDPTP
ncbi:hypothetical protein SCOR_27550 [Sulfidibacter corallicola]|uniref:Uncharacterized protein n=1 Tax=Sulfidibacter corallicola TaxID=2818388 RepID=A0A8A4TNZ7_SULCO|nr:hypothetical protein [Sulfidibacter corallicola]QTD50688.1 hypothetical protein J3U87_34310 [Sulfidibacter corallicola]